MKSSYGIALLASTFLVMPASAQTFNQFIGFGDSTIDSGYFRNAINELSAGQQPRVNTAIRNGGSITPSGGLMSSQILASYFGLTADPSNAPGGGTNYAVYGARINDLNRADAIASPSFVQQVNNYLAATGGKANPNGLYLISIGGNDINALRDTQPGRIITPGPVFDNFFNPRIAALTSSVAALKAAGAQYFIVPSQGPLYAQAVWGSLSAAGINFIPADTPALYAAVAANPARFGFASSTTAACNRPIGAPAAIAGWGLYCIPSTTPAGVFGGRTAFLASADAFQTNFLADETHLSPAGQKIQADYHYSLLVAPSQISFLTESTIQARRGVTLGIQEQIDITQRRNTPGFNVWFNGDVSSLKLNNSSPGFPSDPSTPVSGTLGGSYTFSNNTLIGAAVTLGQLDPTFSSGGGFREQEVAATIFGATRQGDLWANAIMSFGWLKYDVNRVVPLGITFDSNQASTRGRNFSVAALTGYDFRHDAITHGPVAGVEVQSVGIDSFTETGSFTSLAFSNIGRTSTVSALGYRAAIDYGSWRPFAQVTWNHEFDDTANRTITATLTTVTAPSYSMPIVQLGRDWASAVVGTTVVLAKDWTGLAAFNAQLGQNGTTNYGGRFGINYAFNSPVGLPVKAKF